MSFRSFFLILLMLIAKYSSAQQTTTETKPKTKKVHGTFYFFWGYNRDLYTRSNINFKNTVSDNYNFTLVDAYAHDKPDMKNFWHWSAITIPQYNAHLGYLFNDKNNLGIEVSWDHLKYFVADDQTLLVKGQIRGRTIDKDTLVTPNFVHIQHTNGNNYLMANIVKKQSLYKRKHIEISTLAKAGVGPLMSVTFSTVLGSVEDISGYFHYHGVVTGVGDDLRVDLYRYFFIQVSGQGAFADYTNTYIGADKMGRSTQTFFSLAYFYGIGFNLPLSRI
jgi:hypothetical protein